MKINLLSEMVIGILNFFGIDVFGCYLWDEEWVVSGSDNFFVLNINVSIL